MRSLIRIWIKSSIRICIWCNDRNIILYCWARPNNPNTQPIDQDIRTHDHKFIITESEGLTFEEIAAIVLTPFKCVINLFRYLTKSSRKF
jgi:hypothetical protein